MTASELLKQMEADEIVDIAECLTIGERVLLASFVGGESVQSLAFITANSVLTSDEVRVAWPTLHCLGCIVDDDQGRGFRLTGKGRKVLRQIGAVR